MRNNTTYQDSSDWESIVKLLLLHEDKETSISKIE